MTDDGSRLSPYNAPRVKDNILTADNKLSLFGQPNETIALQIVFEGGNTQSTIDITLESIGQIKNRKTSDDPERYFVGRHIEFFEAHAVSIPFRSHDLAWRPKSNAEPPFLFKSVFEPLGVFKNPFIVPPNERRVIWIDVWIPRTIESKAHHGVLSVQESGQQPTTFEIEIDVGTVALPDKPTTKTMLWSSVFEHEKRYVAGRYFVDPTTQNYTDLRHRHHHLAKRHRITLINGVYRGNTKSSRTYLDGSAYSRARGYEGPGQDIGDDVLILKAYGGELARKEKAEWQKLLKSLKQPPEALLYTYDEPRITDETLQLINRRARSALPIGSLVTHSFDRRLDVSTFVAAAGEFKLSAAQRIASKNKQSWIYNGTLPHTGSFTIDDVAISTRVNPWIQYNYNIQRWFYWEATYYQDFQGHRDQIDVWQHGFNFSNRHGDQMMGDGLLFYPGTDLHFPQSNQGVLRPLPSIRLKNWRRGIEDVEYLVLAKKRGLNVKEFIDHLIPKALDTAIEAQPPSWPQLGAPWRESRRALFNYIEKGIPVTQMANKNIKIANKNSTGNKTTIFIILIVFTLVSLLLANSQRRDSRSQ